MSELRVAVRAIIYKPNLGVLTLKREINSTGGGKLCLPGGKSEGESPNTAITKELLEELGVSFRANQIFTIRDSPPWLSIYFLGKTVGEPRAIEPGTEVRWVQRTEITTLDFAFGHEKIIEEYFQSL